MRQLVWLSGLLTAAAMLGCGDDAGKKRDGEPAADGGALGSQSLDDPDHVLEVQLTLADEDWTLVRGEGRSLADIFTNCDDPAFAYTSVAAEARVDGQDLGTIGLRKKGYLGSLSAIRPSLRLDVAEFAADQRWDGSKVITLNNSRQDPSYTRTCMAYAVFEQAGVPAPRCAFAHVTVNGEDLGLYVHVEAVKKPFLARRFGDDSGNLYEGAGGADFRTDMLDGFEQKTNESAPSLEAIERVVDALDQTGGARDQALEAAIDLDAFMRFWATESLLSHWDGYAGDLNNFFVYERPSGDKLVFIPWGTDAAFEKNHGFLPEIGRPKSVLAWARLPNVLYAQASTREAYRDVLRSVLDEAWDESALLAEVERIETLVRDAGLPLHERALAEQRDFIDTRRAELEAELSAPAPAWPFPQRSVSGCQSELATEVSGTFSASWGNINALAASPDLALSVVIDGKLQTLTNLRASAGPFTDETSGDESPALRMIGFRSDGTFVLTQLNLGPRDELSPGELPFHGLETFGFVALGGGTGATLRVIGLIGQGTITFEAAATKPAAPVKAHFQATLVETNLGTP